MACAELSKHALGTKNGRAVVVANTLQQINEAVLPELRKFIPPWMIRRQTKSPLYIVLTNGFDYYCSASDQQLRSLNLTALLQRLTSAS